MTGPLHLYRAYGLSIESSLAIPGAKTAIAPFELPDIVVAEGCTAIGAVDATSGPYSRSGAALLLEVPGVARYLAPSSAELVIEQSADADPDEVAALLVATALPMLLWMRSGIVLHAAGIVLPGCSSAVALAGPSGIGKSTLAHRLVERGANFVGDDSLLVSSDGNGPQVTGLCASCFLPAPDAAQRVAHAIPAARQTERAPLGALVVLARANSGSARPPVRLTGPEALEALLQNRHRPRVPALVGRNAAVLTDMVTLIRDVPIYQVEIPDGDTAGAQARLLTLAETLREAR